MKAPTWWCADDFGPVEDGIPDITQCFMYTCIKLPLAVIFTVVFLVRNCCKRTRDEDPGLYRQLLFGNGTDDRSGINNLGQLCTTYSRPLWVSVSALAISPFAEIGIRFVLGVVEDGDLYPYVGIIISELFCSAAYTLSIYELLKREQITTMVRWFWVLQLLVCVKEIEGGIVRSLIEDVDELIFIHGLKLLFNLCLLVYSINPSLVGEEDVLWPAEESVQYTSTQHSRSWTPRSGIGTVKARFGAPSVMAHRGSGLRAKSSASESVWDAFLHEGNNGVNGHPGIGAAGGVPPPGIIGAPAVSGLERKDVSSLETQRTLADPSPARSGVGTGPIFRDSPLTSLGTGGIPDFTEATLRVTTWLVRNKGKGEEVNFAVQVNGRSDMVRRLGSDGVTFRVWRPWARFQTLDSEVRRSASLHKAVPPELPARRSGGSSGQRLLERDRSALELYINQVMADRRYWRPLARFLHVEVRITFPKNIIRSQQRSKSEHVVSGESPPIHGVDADMKAPYSYDPMLSRKPEETKTPFPVGSPGFSGPSQRLSEALTDHSGEREISFSAPGTSTKHLGKHVSLFFENLFQVSVPEWTKWTANKGSVQTLFSVRVTPRVGDPFETRKRPEDFKQLRIDIQKAMREFDGRSRASQVPVLPKDPGDSTNDDKHMETVRIQYQGFLQEVSEVFQCEALYKFLCPVTQLSGTKLALSPPSRGSPLSRTPETPGDGLNPPGSLRNLQENPFGKGGKLLAASQASSRNPRGVLGVGAGGSQLGLGLGMEMKNIGVKLVEGIQTLPDTKGQNRMLFRGSDAVDFLVVNGISRNREHAVEIGNSLMLELGLFDHIDFSFAFRDDEDLLYVLHPEKVDVSVSIPKGLAPVREIERTNRDDENGISIPGSTGKHTNFSIANASIGTAAGNTNSGGLGGGGQGFVDSSVHSSGIRFGGDDEDGMVVGSAHSAQSIPGTGNRRKTSMMLEDKDHKQTEFFLAKKGGRRTTNMSHRFEADVRGYIIGNPTLYNIHVREYYSTSQYLDYTIRKRYSDFEKFRRNLVSVHSETRVPQLPTKMQPLMQKKTTFLQVRAKGLETFLKRVINSEVYQGHELFEFLAKNSAQQSLTLGYQVADVEASLNADS